MKERPVLESIIAEIHRRAEKEWAGDGYDFEVTITADEYKDLCVEEATVTDSPAPDHIGHGKEIVRDAERYRWLRNRRHSDIEVIGPHGDEDEQFLYGEELDEAIDAQLQ